MKASLLNRMHLLTAPELYRELYRDPLTSVLNRHAFNLEVESDEFNHFIAIADLDSLKWFNDTFNYRTGDEELIRLGRSLVNKFSEDNVYRLSGDEFAVINYHVTDLRVGLEEVRSRVPGFSYGIGTTLPTANESLKTDKKRREFLGLRAVRGQRPPYLPETRTSV